MEDTIYTIGELAEQAGVTPRTIRYYTAEGLLPRPDARGQYALYSAEHLLRLRLIARLKDSFLPLGEIRARIEGLDAEQIRALLDEELPAPAAPPTSAADYLAQVLTRPGAPLGLAEASAGYQIAAPAPAAAMQAPAPAFAPAPPAPASGLLQRLLPSRREQAKAAPLTAAPDEQQWRHIALAPGVELQVREPLADALREPVAQLLARARELFQGE